MPALGKEGILMKHRDCMMRLEDNHRHDHHDHHDRHHHHDNHDNGDNHDNHDYHDHHQAGRVSEEARSSARRFLFNIFSSVNA